MSEFDEVERDEIAVQFVRAADGVAGAPRAWEALEQAVGMQGRHLYGSFDPVANDYRACVEVREGDELAEGLEAGTLAGGRYLRARVQGEPPAVYGQIGPMFEAMVQEREPDMSRLSLEHYKSRGEIDLLLPI